MEAPNRRDAGRGDAGGQPDLRDLASSHVTVLNGLTLDGFVQVGAGSNYYGYLDFVGTQSLSGTGSIFFDDSKVNTVRVRDSGTTLTIGPGITIHGVNGSVGYNPLLSGSHNDVAVIDHGTVSPDFAGGTIILRADNGFTAAGPLQASNGATLALQGTWSIGTRRASVRDRPSSCRTQARPWATLRSRRRQPPPSTFAAPSLTPVTP